MLNASVPPTPTVAVTTAPLPAPPPTPTWSVIVSSVFAIIAVWIPAIGSELGKLVLDTALGYGWFEKKLSFEHLNTSPPVSIPTVSLVVRPWFGIVNNKVPVWDV